MNSRCRTDRAHAPRSRESLSAPAGERQRISASRRRTGSSRRQRSSGRCDARVRGDSRRRVRPAEVQLAPRRSVLQWALLLLRVRRGQLPRRPRITRIGNHPRTQGRLVGRLRDHYATRPNAKNGSVFRRYLGGALLRTDGMEGCLAPGPGQGHWEIGKGLECECCVGYEERVTARLLSSFDLVRADRRPGASEPSRGSTHASVAQCGACQPSPRWLGSSAYPQNVRSTGLWNSQRVGWPSRHRRGHRSVSSPRASIRRPAR